MNKTAILIATVCLGLAANLAHAAKFSIVVVPDTQFYAENYPDLIEAQMQWIVDNRDLENIVYVATLGDMKDDGECTNIVFDDGGTPADPSDDETEWSRVRDAYDRIEVAAPGYPDGVPYGVVPGNHDFDQDPATSVCAIATRQLTEFDAAFGPGAFLGRAYYGGPRTAGTNDDNSTVFTGCGVDFVSINLGFRSNTTGEIPWADGLLTADPGRLGILTSHGFMQENIPGNNGQFDAYGAQVASALAPRQNLFLMLAAHRRGEAWREETLGRPVGLPLQALMSDYQDILYPAAAAPNFACLDSINDTANPADAPGCTVAGAAIADDKLLADSAFMRIMRFDTVTRMVEVTTFSPRIPPATVTSAFTRPADLESDVTAADGTVMNKFTASNLSFSYAGYVNLPPAAADVTITSSTSTGGVASGAVLTGSYTFSDADGDAEGATLQRWLRDGVDTGVAGNSYTVQPGDAGSDITYEVTAVAASGVASGCADSATVRVREQADVVLVLDRSGSMNGASAVSGSKRDAMQDAANLFIDQIAADATHRLGLVQFNQAPVAFVAPDDFPFSLLVEGADGTPGTSGSARAAVDSITAGGSTDILEGLEEGLATIDVGAPSDRRIAVLFTDGRHNSPSQLADIPTLRDELLARIDAVDSGIDFYSIGFGTDVSDAALVEATDLRNGWHVNETDPLIMAKGFSAAAAAVMDAATIVDPVYQLSLGGTAIQPIPLTAAERDLTVVVNWERVQKIRPQVRLIAPGGDACAVPAGGSDVYRREGDNYTIIKIDLPFDCGGYPRHAGEWRVRIAAPEQAREGLRANVAAYSTTRVRLAAGLLRSQSLIEISAVIEGADLRNPTMTAYLLSPLPETDDSLDEDRLGSEDGAAIPPQRRYPRLATPIKLETGEDGRQRYVGKASIDLDEFGLYPVRVVAEGTDGDGNLLRREANATIYYPRPRDFGFIHWILLLILTIMLLAVVRQILFRR